MRPVQPEQVPPPFTAIETVSRADGVRDQIAQAIRSGYLKPGEPIPSERQLVETFGVSRVSVREAMRSLEAMGLVEVFQGRGSFVARGPGERVLEPFVHWLRLHREEIDLLVRVRGALDELAAEEVASHPDRPEVARIVAAHEAFAAVAESDTVALERLSELDRAFHLAIADASRQALLVNLLTELNSQLDESRNAMLAPVWRRARSAREHAAIVAAIQVGDPPKARSAAARHIRAVRDLLAKAIDGKTDGEIPAREAPATSRRPR